jgi:uncharacterized protein (DUF1499 family)
MNQNNTEVSSTRASEAGQSPPKAKRQQIWEKYDSEPMSFIMRNPKATPIVLLVLAVAPVVIVVSVLAVIFLMPEFSSQF